ncbi:MAG TPA: acyltransferase family protein [Bryobacteraceae bacterium]|nr:acyltransferase family protein [Bryobacteraceae bacterium]
MKRFPFLDWMRGLAVVVMIQCHAFNSFARLDVREGGPYIFSQFVGGMAAPLFLFMAGMTFAFQMDSLERRQPRAGRRWLSALRRAGYIMAIALAFRFSNWLGSYPNGSASEILKVDILNCMAVAMAAVAPLALLGGANRARGALFTALAIAALSPIMANLPWGSAAPLVREYLVPIPGRGRFPFFPCAAYLAFGLAAGAIVKRTAAERMERLMQWSLVIGLGAVFISQYFSNLPYSIYSQSNFWTDSPALILIRTGAILAAMAGAYLWTEYGARPVWSWVQTLGKTSLMVYWVHVVMVYGALAKPIKRTLSIPQATFATAALIALMVLLSVLKLNWTAKRAAKKRAGMSVAGSRPVPEPSVS